MPRSHFEIRSMHLLDFARDVRAIHLQMLEASLSHRETRGSCLFACILLTETLQQFMPHSTSIIRGGDGKGDGGFQDRAGAWHGHYWVEVELNAQRYVVDITADQFGEEDIVVLPVSQATRYAPGNQNETNAGVASEMARVQKR